jgi:hypothetical protein
VRTFHSIPDTAKSDAKRQIKNGPGKIRTPPPTNQKPVGKNHTEGPFSRRNAHNTQLTQKSKAAIHNKPSDFSHRRTDYKSVANNVRRVAGGLMQMKMFMSRLARVRVVALIVSCLGPIPAVAGIRPADLRAGYDVVIAGAGTGGTMAAVQAARLGCSVLLLEESDWVGGQMTAAGVSSMDEASSRVRERGLYREFTQRVNHFYEGLGISTDTPAIAEGHMAVEPRVAQRVLLQMLSEAKSEDGRGGVDLLLLSRVVSVSKVGNRVTGIEVVTDDGKSATAHKVQSKVLIDATELGSVLPMTGARYRLGKFICGGDDATTMPPVSPIQDYTWTAVIKAYPDGAPAQLLLHEKPPGYDRERFRQALNNPLPDTSKDPWSWQRFIDYRGTPDSSRPDPSVRNPWAKVTRTHINIDANDVSVSTIDIADPARFRRLEYAMKVKTLGLLYYIQNDMDAPMTTWTVAIDEGYDTPDNRRRNAQLVAEHPGLAPFLPVLNYFPPMPYAREGRRVVGLTTMRARDIDRRTGPMPMPHAVALGDYPVDVHGSPRPEQLEPDLDTGTDLEAIGFSPDRMGPFPVPFEAFIPEKIDGLLVAEKNLSQSRLVNGATRLQPGTMLTGQAAGAIAALAVRSGVEPRALHAIEVQDTLLHARDVLFARRDGQENLPGVQTGSPLWRDVQLALLYGGLDLRDAVGWRGEWKVMAGYAGPGAWDENVTAGLTVHSPVAAMAVLLQTTAQVNECAKLHFCASGSAQLGLVGRVRDARNYVSARVLGNRLEILRWQETGVILLNSSTMPRLRPGTSATLSFEMNGPRLFARVLGDGNTELARCEATDQPTSGAVGIRLFGREPFEVRGFEWLTPDGNVLYATAFPRTPAFQDASLTPATMARLRQHLQGTGAANLLDHDAPGRLAPWVQAFAAHLRRNPADADILSARISSLQFTARNSAVPAAIER